MSSNQLAAFNYGVPPYANLPIKTITAAYRVQPSDNGWIINCTSGTFTVALPPAGTLPVGFNCVVWNTTNNNNDAITIDPNGSETIDGQTTFILRRGEGTQVICDGITWYAGNKKTMRMYAENISFGDGDFRPIATGISAFAIGRNPSATNSNSFAIGTLASATGVNAHAIGTSSTASASLSFAIGGGATASSSNSLALGVNSAGNGSQAVTGSGAMALGGSRASGTDSFAAAIANNTSNYGATGANAVSIGYFAKASANYSMALGVYSIASAVGSIAISTDHQALYTTSASAANSVAIGAGASSAIVGKFSYASSSFTDLGEAQTGIYVLIRGTTNATATVLTTNGSAPGTTNQVNPPNNSAYAFTGTVVARRQAAGGTESAAWKIEGLIRREANAASTTLVASTVTAISNAPGWTLALSADTTNGGLKIEATGAASTNIRWVATVQTSEVTYA